eukprot:5422261-Prymnesium_polylepis.1
MKVSSMRTSAIACCPHPFSVLNLATPSIPERSRLFLVAKIPTRSPGTAKSFERLVSTWTCSCCCGVKSSAAIFQTLWNGVVL